MEREGNLDVPAWIENGGAIVLFGMVLLSLAYISARRLNAMFPDSPPRSADWNAQGS